MVCLRCAERASAYHKVLEAYMNLVEFRRPFFSATLPSKREQSGNTGGNERTDYRGDEVPPVLGLHS